MFDFEVRNCFTSLRPKKEINANGHSVYDQFGLPKKTSDIIYEYLNWFKF